MHLFVPLETIVYVKGCYGMSLQKKLQQVKCDAVGSPFGWKCYYASSKRCFSFYVELPVVSALWQFEVHFVQN